MDKIRARYAAWMAMAALCGSALLCAGCGDGGSSSAPDVEESSSSSWQAPSSSARNESKSSSSAKSSSSRTSPSSSSSDKEIASSSSAPRDDNSSSSQSVHERLTEIYGECRNAGIAYASYMMDSEKNWYTCYLGEWSEGYIDVDRYPWEPPQESFLNPDIEYGELKDSRDGNVYKTVEIGEQVWMAENLRYADSVATPSLKGKTWCYKDRPEMCDVVGLYYTWAAAIDSVRLATDSENPLDCGNGKECGITGPVQGICPEGWRLPTMDEFDVLQKGAKYTPADYTAFWASSSFRSLRSSVGWDACWLAEEECFTESELEHLGNKDNTNTTGFSAIPAGYRFPNGDMQSPGVEAFFWSSTEYSTNYAGSLSLNRNLHGVMQWDDAGKVLATNVRCIKD